MRPALLVVFVDALGPEQAELIASEGLALPERATLTGVLGYSSGALPTILTGAPPSRHGRMCLFSRLESTSSPLSPLRLLGLLPRIVHERTRVRSLAARLLAKAHGYDGYLALHRVPPALFAKLDVPEREDLFHAREIGGAPTFLARARDAGLRVAVSDWRRPEAERVRQLEAMPQADLAFLYLSGLDAILHRTGTIDRDARDWARAAVRWIKDARRALGAREVRTLVVGDHGMAAVHTVVDPRPVLAKLATSELAFVDSTMLRISGAAPSARDALVALPGTTLDATALAERDAPTSRYGDLIHVLPEGTIFAPSFVGGRVGGMHGYDRTARSADAALMSDAPLGPGLTRLEDVAPWVCGALDLPTTEVA